MSWKQMLGEALAQAAAELPPLAEEHELIAAAKQGDRTALDRLIRTQLREIALITVRYRAAGAEQDDLIQEALVGVLESLARFDSARQLRLMRLARLFIRSKCWDLLAKRHLPDCSIREGRQVLSRIETAEREIESETGQPADAEQIAARLSKISAERVAALQALRRGCLSLYETPRTESNRCPRQETISSDIGDPEQLLTAQQLRRAAQLRIAELLGELSENERAVIELRYLSDPHLLQREVADRLGMRRASVWTVENRALTKMRSLARKRGFEPYLRDFLQQSTQEGHRPGMEDILARTQ